VFRPWCLLIPVNKELLLVVLSARRPDMFAWYATIAAIGSVISCVLLYELGRRAGQLLQHRIKARHSALVQKHVHRHGGYALALGAILPPPFPFTSLVMAAGAVGYSIPKFLGTISIARFIRFALVAGVAAHWSDSVLQLWESRATQLAAFALLLCPLALASIPALRWVKRFRSQPAS